MQVVDFLDVSKDLRAFNLGENGPVAAIVLLHLCLEDLDGRRMNGVRRDPSLSYSNDIRQHRHVVSLRLAQFHADEMLVILLGAFVDAVLVLVAVESFRVRCVVGVIADVAVFVATLAFDGRVQRRFQQGTVALCGHRRQDQRRIGRCRLIDGVHRFVGFAHQTETLPEPLDMDDVLPVFTRVVWIGREKRGDIAQDDVCCVVHIAGDVST